MGVFESTVHFDSLTAVIDNHSPYEIKFRVTRPGHLSNEKSTQTYETQNQKLLPQEQALETESLEYVYTGLVMPYSTKYYEFKDIQKEYRFWVCALKMTQDKKQITIPFVLKHSMHQDKIRSQGDPPDKRANLIFEGKKRGRNDLLKAICDRANSVVEPQTRGFFNECPFKVKLLFRASDHHFDVNQFYNKFGLIESVLLICKIKNNKIIGGYSRQSFISPGQTNFDSNGWKNIRDETNSSFIFSLSNNDLFRIKQGQNALFYHRNHEQICFGSDQLRINNHSDKNVCLSQNFNANYENHNYNNDSESYKLFNGNESPEFTTIEWEVWAINFQQESEEYDDSALLALALDI